MFNGNIVITEVSLNRRGLLIWALIIAIVILINLGSFNFFKDVGLVEMVEEYPQAFRVGLGITPEIFTNVNHYHGGLVMLYVLLISSIYSMSLAGGMIIRDMELGVVEFLYTRPVTRSVIVVSKAAAFLILMTLLWIILYLISTIVGAFGVAPALFDIYAQFTVHFMGYLACLAAGGVAFALAPFLEKTQASTYLSLGVGGGFFLLNSLSVMYESLGFLSFFTFYYYANLAGAAMGKPFMTGMFVLPVVFIIGVSVSAVLIRSKDFD